MQMRPRIHYTESQKALMWERWQKGESLQQIAQSFDRNHSSSSERCPLSRATRYDQSWPVSVLRPTVPVRPTPVIQLARERTL
ncbi:MAG TPA: hypothetical protein VKP69_18480, partial [Isosphaeraceae bacterium]|nr:hypothetical protein [Isosphaeraceae bacterium]